MESEVEFDKTGRFLRVDGEIAVFDQDKSTREFYAIESSASGSIFDSPKYRGLPELNPFEMGIVEYMHRDERQWDDNNGVLAYVSEEGKVYIGPKTRENLEYLLQQGYKHDLRWSGVPMSNGEKFFDEKLQEVWEKLLGK